MIDSQLPPILLIEDLARVLNTSVRTLNRRRADARRRVSTFPFSELPRIDRKPRWSRDHVLAVISGQRKAVR